MKTAKELAELTQLSKIGITQIIECAEIMANNGLNFYAKDLQKVNVTDELVKQLQDLGYTVTIKPEFDHFKIEW